MLHAFNAVSWLVVMLAVMGLGVHYGCKWFVKPDRETRQHHEPPPEQHSHVRIVKR